MNKRRIFQAISILLLILTILAVICGVSAAGGNFLNLRFSNTVRGFCIAVATISAGLACFFYGKSR